MKLKKGVKNLGEAIKNVPGVKRNKSYGGMELIIGDEHKIEFWSFGNRYFSEVNIDEYKFSPLRDEEIISRLEKIELDDEPYGLWNEINEINLTFYKCK